MKIDLHIHTTYSDGVYSPEKVVDAAIEAGLDAIAITDHDNVLSYPVAKDYLDKIQPENSQKPLIVIPGIEINTIYKGYEVHILGYYMDMQNADFQKIIKIQQNARIKQTKEILKLLAKKEGIKINIEDIKNTVAEGGSIGRPHLAKAICQAGGTASVVEAYNKYINSESPVYVQRKTVSPHEAVETIYDAGGVPVFAHPYDVDIADVLIKDLMNYGLRGIEAYHRKHSPAMVEYFSTLAEKYGLIMTGGSDFHAPHPSNGNVILGKSFIPDWIYGKLIEEKKRLDMA